MCYNHFMTQKKAKFPFKLLLYILTAVLVVAVVANSWPDIEKTLEYLKDPDKVNDFVLLLLIPEQLFMYYACGQIFFSYLRHRHNVRKFTKPEILRISTELNFVNHAIPAGGVGGLAFLTYRLGQYNVSPGQASFLYIFRYAVTTVINYFQALIAIVILLMLGKIPAGAEWIISVALLMNMGVLGFLWLVIYIASSNKRITFFAKTCAALLNFVMRIITFGHKKHMVKDEKIHQYFDDIHVNVKIARENKRYLKKPALWGFIYSFCEIGTYWIVAISLGRPELLPVIMVGEAIGSVFDGIVPYGLYELGMAGVMIALGVPAPEALIITVMTRAITLIFTIVSGAIPYAKAIRGQKHAEK